MASGIPPAHDVLNASPLPHTMFRFRQRPGADRFCLLGHLCVALAMVLLFALNVLAAWPAAHAGLHAFKGRTANASASCSCSDDAATGATSSSLPYDDAGCVVTLFAQGRVHLTVTLLVEPAVLIANRAPIITRTVLLEASLDLRLPPGSGPPSLV